MANLNKVMLIGRLGQDPELKNHDGGNSVCNFSIATNETWNDKKTNEKVENTEWHNIVMWGRLAELASEYLRKGSQVYVEGKLQTRNWDDDSGNKRYKTEVVAFKMEFMDSKPEENSDEAEKFESQNKEGEPNDLKNIRKLQESLSAKDDIPF